MAGNTPAPAPAPAAAPPATVTVADLILENADLRARVAELEAHLDRVLALPGACPLQAPRPCASAPRPWPAPLVEPTARLGDEEGRARLAAASAEVHEWAAADRRRRAAQAGTAPDSEPVSA